jgi:hypothetical protein
MAGKSELIPADKLEAIRRAVPSPPMSQEHSTNLAAAVPLLDLEIITQAISTMEEASAASQGASPALVHIPRELWNALREVVKSPASKLPKALAHSSSFSQARDPTPSCGSSPMEMSPPSLGQLAAPVPLPPSFGDHPEAPIVLSSDESSAEQMPQGPPPGAPATGSQGGTRGRHGPLAPLGHDSTSPLSGTSSPTPHASGESALSEYSSGQDVAHPILLSSDHSSFHSSDRVSIPDMGSAHKGGKMSTGKATDQYEDASPAVLAWARYLNVIPAKDTKSITPDHEPLEVRCSLPILQLFATTPLTDGSVFNYEVMREVHEEAAGAMEGVMDKLNRVREGFSHYFLRDPIELLLLQDSVDGLHATIWRAHEGQIQAWTEHEVLSVYKRLSDICLSDILDLIKREATTEEITEAMKEDIALETRGKFKGCIAEEKTRTFETALEEARSDSLCNTCAQGTAEAAQRGRAYRNMLLSRAEAEAKIEADALFKSQLESAHSKLKHKVEAEVEVEHDEAIAERWSALKKSLAEMDFNARKDYV